MERYPPDLTRGVRQSEEDKQAIKDSEAELSLTQEKLSKLRSTVEQQGRQLRAIKAKEQTKSDLEGEMASDSEARTQENTTKADNEGQLKAVMDYLKEIAPGCDFIAMNFNIRLTNRQRVRRPSGPPRHVSLSKPSGLLACKPLPALRER